MINRTDYVAAHIRVADAHWDAADCQHKMNGNPISSVSCGDGLNVINYSSIAQEIWYVLRISGDKKQARAHTGGGLNPEAPPFSPAPLTQLLRSTGVRRHQHAVRRHAAGALSLIHI